MNDTALLTFKAISNFVNELAEVYGKNHKPLKLYRHLINKTQISHDKVILKHIECFRKFCVANRDAIHYKDASKFTKDVVKYSSRVHVNVSLMIELSDNETADAIWNHVLCISAFVDPAGKAKEILRKNKELGKSGANETDFITNIISKVEENVKSDADPTAAVSSILSSGIFTDLIGGMQGGLSSGQLDIGKLLGAVQGMVSSLGNQVGDAPEAAGAMNMLSSMTSMMGNMAGKDGQMNPPDMSKMMEGMQGMMKNMVPPPQPKETKVEEVQDDEK